MFYQQTVEKYDTHSCQKKVLIQAGRKCSSSNYY